MEARYMTDLEWRICHAVNIYIFKNGNDIQTPILVHIPPARKKNMQSVMNTIQERVSYPVGYAKTLYTMDGRKIRHPCELEMYNNYVVASNFEKTFKCVEYGRKRSPLLILNKFSKHIRVLRLQNKNYDQWLIKKREIGSERPQYVYPERYIHEGILPQDLPVDRMGNTYVPNCDVDLNGQGQGYVDGPVSGRGQNRQDYTVNAFTTELDPIAEYLQHIKPNEDEMPDVSNKFKVDEDQMFYKPQKIWRTKGVHDKREKYPPLFGKASDVVNANIPSVIIEEETADTSELEDINDRDMEGVEDMYETKNSDLASLEQKTGNPINKPAKNNHLVNAQERNTHPINPNEKSNPPLNPQDSNNNSVNTQNKNSNSVNKQVKVRNPLNTQDKYSSQINTRGKNRNSVNSLDKNRKTSVSTQERIRKPVNMTEEIRNPGITPVKNRNLGNSPEKNKKPVVIRHEIQQKMYTKEKTRNTFNGQEKIKNPLLPNGRNAVNSQQKINYPVYLQTKSRNAPNSTQEQINNSDSGYLPASNSNTSKTQEKNKSHAYLPPHSKNTNSAQKINPARIQKENATSNKRKMQIFSTPPKTKRKIGESYTIIRSAIMCPVREKQTQTESMPSASEVDSECPQSAIPEPERYISYEGIFPEDMHTNDNTESAFSSNEDDGPNTEIQSKRFNHPSGRHALSYRQDYTVQSFTIEQDPISAFGPYSERNDTSGNHSETVRQDQVFYKPQKKWRTKGITDKNKNAHPPLFGRAFEVHTPSTNEEEIKDVSEMEETVDHNFEDVQEVTPNKYKNPVSIPEKKNIPNNRKRFSPAVVVKRVPSVIKKASFCRKISSIESNRKMKAKQTQTDNVLSDCERISKPSKSTNPKRSIHKGFETKRLPVHQSKRNMQIPHCDQESAIHLDGVISTTCRDQESSTNSKQNNATKDSCTLVEDPLAKYLRIIEPNEKPGSHVKEKLKRLEQDQVFYQPQKKWRSKGVVDKSKDKHPPLFGRASDVNANSGVKEKEIQDMAVAVLDEVGHNWEDVEEVNDNKPDYLVSTIENASKDNKRKKSITVAQKSSGKAGESCKITITF